MHDVARINQKNRRGEVVGVLKKEGTKLGVIDRIALIDGELRLIGLDVAEVGVDGRIKDDAVFENRLELAACRALNVA